MQHAAEFRRCLVELDVAGVRRLWKHVSPHLTQPASDEEALHTCHLARREMKTLEASLVAYSESWLGEREKRTVAHAVGIAVLATSPRRQTQALAMQHAMSDAVLDAIKEGVSLELDSKEIKRRMLVARENA